MVDREVVKEWNIFQRMDAITDSLAVVQKNLEVGFGKSKYKAVSERDVIDAVKPLEHDFGVYSYPVKREVLESHILESDEVYVDNNAQTEQRKTKTTFMSRIKTVYRFVNVDKPDEYIDQESFAEGIDTQDKGSGKAMTYSDKYALMKAYKISTGDDPDQNASEPEHYKEKDKKKNGGISDYQKKVILSYPPETQAWACNHYGLLSIDEMSAEQATEIINAVNKKKKGA